MGFVETVPGNKIQKNNKRLINRYSTLPSVLSLFSLLALDLSGVYFSCCQSNTTEFNLKQKGRGSKVCFGLLYFKHSCQNHYHDDDDGVMMMI